MKREGRQGVGEAHGTDEAGTPPPRDPVEGRGGRVIEPGEGKTTGPQTPGTVSTKLARIAKLARDAPAMAFRSLAHVIDMDLLREAFARTRKDGATGVDRQTAEMFEADLEANLQALLTALKSKTYRAPPVRRVHIPKGDGKTRPLGIPTFADKVLQRAVAMVLGAVYEQDFLSCSYGFRPRRSAHQALEDLWQGLMSMGGGWVLDVDIKGYFDSIDGGHLRRFLDQRVVDGVIRCAIDKWLKAGVLEEGALTFPETGTPQGGVISPLLANIFLHEVLDKWFHGTVIPRLRGRAFLIRYADDFVIACCTEDDAQTIMATLPKRFGKYGLTLHPEKTRLVPFRSPGKSREPVEPGTFDLLGFTHVWGKSRKGHWVVKRSTAKKRLVRALKSIADWCWKNLHEPVAAQAAKLGQKLRGHCQYYGITGNSQGLQRFRRELLTTWWRALNRRMRGARLTWERFKRLLGIFPIPPAYAVHSVCRPTANL